MATAHVSRALTNPDRDTQRAVTEELEALRQRRRQHEQVGQK